MKIEMVTSSYLDVSIGGVETHIYELSRHLIRRGHQVSVVRTSSGDSSRDFPSDVPLKVLRAGQHARKARNYRGGEIVRRLSDGIASRAEAAETMASKPDLIHFHDLVEAFPLASRISAAVPLAWTNHLGEFLTLAGSKPGRTVAKYLTSPYAAGIAPSSELCDQSACSPPMSFIPNGYDPLRFHPLPESIRLQERTRLGVSQDRPVILVPRRWAPNKGIEYFAQALTELRLSAGGSVPVVLFVGGCGDRYRHYQRQVERMLQGSSLECRVVGAVSHSEMIRYYQVADLTVIPSIREATSLSALESLGCGTPVLGTTVGGLVDIEKVMTTGIILVPPRDPVALASALESIMAADWGITSAKAQRLSGEAQRHYAWEAVAAAVERIYKRALAA